MSFADIKQNNYESGFGRYDVMIEPKDKEKDAFILEFKVHDPSFLIAKGISKEKIHKYGFTFEGKKVLIG